MFAIVTNVCLITILFYSSSADNVIDRYYPYYHLAPPFGWMNDPNGFCVFKKEYHIFYQHNPLTSQKPGIAHWKHAKSKDLFNWEHLPIALYPDQEYDKSGVFSGSAIVENDTMYLFYTGNVNFPGHKQLQALASSDDAMNFTKYSGNPIIRAEEHQPDIRDPKVWKHKNTYYMVLGNSNKMFGRVLLYASRDMINWMEISVLGESVGNLGYMWECPDFFQLGNYWVLLFSPQGIEPQGDKFKNLYQTGYIVGEFDYDTNEFLHKTEFKELDYGHDFYATQSILDESGRRIVVAWFDMWEQVYPERNDNWAGTLTIPRVLELTENLELIQLPVKEIEVVQGDMLFSGEGSLGIIVKLPNNAGKIKITTCTHKNLVVFIQGGINTTVTISYNYLTNKVTLDRGGTDGERRTKWIPKHQLEMEIYIDRSTIEVFCGKGEVTFSSRFFPDKNVSVSLGSPVDKMIIHSMKRTVTRSIRYY